MNNAVAPQTPLRRQRGLTLIEMMVSVAISLVVLSGVIGVLVVSKTNFVTQREMATMQENARFALKYMTDEIRQAGFTGCVQPAYTVSIIKGSTTNSTGSWYLDFPGLQGYEYDVGVGTFPTEFRSEVRANTDAIVVRRGEATGLRVSSDIASVITAQTTHSYKPGQPMLVVSPDCDLVGFFQISAVTSTTLSHNTGTASPGNAIGGLKTTVTPVITYSAAGSIIPGGTATPTNTGHPVTSPLLALHSEAYYIGNSESDSTVPALFRERMMINTSTNTPYTAEEELVQGVENMQILYGMDNTISSSGAAGSDGLADIYVKANAVIGAGGWNNVVSVRLTLRLRSISPVYVNNESYATFEGVAGTSGSDKYMRQTISSTIMTRNYKL